MNHPSFEECRNGSDIECPYCGYYYQAEAEDCDQDGRVEDCDKCNKKFYFHASVSVDYVTRPDCELNGTPHDFSDGADTTGTAVFCKVCDKCKLLTELPEKD